MSDLNGKLITIFGGGGFLGRYIARPLLAAGARLRIAERNPHNARHIKPLGGLGQTQFMVADIRNRPSVERAVHGADMVVNLVGILKGDFTAFHVDGAANVAQCASDAGCEAMLHMSAIGADPHSSSRYGQSKGYGELAVRKAFAGAIILRPSVVFGAEDQFINRFAKMIALSPVLPIMGSDTRFQPVYADDVGQATALILNNHAKYKGTTFELGGPETLSMAELNQRIANAIGVNPHILTMPDMVSGLMASATGWLPGAPITRDQWIMLQDDNIVSKGSKTLKTLGITATPLSSVLPDMAVRYRRHGRFAKKGV